MSMHEGIGCKGGTSALAGKVAAVYEIELPDGRKVRKSTFKVSAPKAVATGFEGRDGKAWSSFGRACCPYGTANSAGLLRSGSSDMSNEP